MSEDPTEKIRDEWQSSLERFAEDLAEHTNIAAAFERDSSREGMHVLRINNIDFFFYADGSGYDGWGKPVD